MILKLNISLLTLLVLALVAPCLSLPSIEDVFGQLWQKKPKDKEETSEMKKERVKRQDPGIVDTSNLTRAATSDS